MSKRIRASEIDVDYDDTDDMVGQDGKIPMGHAPIRKMKIHTREKKIDDVPERAVRRAAKRDSFS